MAVSVGIDLGTTFSAVAIVDPQTKMPKIIPNSEGNKITPSVIQFINGKPVFGSEAESAFAASEPGCAATFKRGMGKTEVYCTIDGTSYTAEDLSALLLCHLKEDAEAELGDIIADAVITVPAYFYSPEREATLRAATAAGLKVKKIIDEPNAAAMAYGLNNWRENANILVYDLGGGTFDVTLTRMGRDGELITITTRGDHFLGGRDWDGRIELILIEKIADETGIDIEDNISIKQMLRGMTEGVKKQLSAMDAAKVTATIPDFGVTSVVITRNEFEEKTTDLIDRTGALCQAVLEEAGVTLRDVTDVLLVGGSTRMPQVSQYILSLFGKKPITHVNPDEAVALGAAIQATKGNDTYTSLSVQVMSDGKKVTNRGNTGLTTKAAVHPSKRLSSVGLLTLRETTAHAMGIIAINDEGNHYYNEIIIPANHPRPVRSAKRFRFYTSAGSKNELEIYVLQGDGVNPLDCLIPYKYVVTGIQHVNKGEKIGTVIRVQYSYDENGIIHIQARQGNAEVDLPIRRDDVPSDISKFGRPVASDSVGSNSSLGLQLGKSGSQGVVHKYKAITFSNVEWEKYDNIAVHPSGAEFNEPSIHIVANEENIEFHGYNVSQMDEGVTYTINADDDFEIECDINTSTIQPHPGGNVKISLGIISASLNESGGSIFLDGQSIADVGSKFKLKMSLTDGGHFEVYINGKLEGSKNKPTMGGIDVLFGLAHDAHCCQILSHAYISDIKMKQRINQDAEDENSEVATWDD
jgi:molecular chaperone DnaK